MCKNKDLEFTLNEDNEQCLASFSNEKKYSKREQSEEKQRNSKKMEQNKKTCCLKELLGDFFRQKNVYVKQMDIVFHQLG